MFVAATAACPLLRFRSLPLGCYISPYRSYRQRRPSDCIRVLAMAGSSTSAAPHRHTNRLASEHSPYLLQHAHNPVPSTRRTFLPRNYTLFLFLHSFFLPIGFLGYSTCHWCHVMEVESFENKEIAKILNEWFVSIKVHIISYNDYLMLTVRSDLMLIR
ncbi:hypothetical protein BHE74_00017510 [Ensete ventricosum]|nr:hypothetical protein GW17_00007972 [Ensete ventricosum]RWW74547.1 hypothetical protein BHE74_00017510 [Ensete ventricosum]RZR81498.1 hypothetical protein BHM03_00007740 [Ensete ventricosum]